jgi:hypothetical protein
MSSTTIIGLGVGADVFLFSAMIAPAATINTVKIMAGVFISFSLMSQK